MRILILLSLMFLFTCWRSSPQWPPAEPESYLNDVVQQMTKKWPDNRIINIVCHGHSVPTGYFKTPVVDTFNSYPHLLHLALKKQFPHAVINVIVTGKGGEHSIKGWKRFEEDVLCHKPDILLIDYALNDRRKGFSKTKESWVKMIEEARSHDIKVLCLTPTADKAARMNDPKDLLNQHCEQVKKIAKEQGVALVDSYQAFKDYVASGKPLNDLMSQDNHPNRQGHELVAREIMKWFPIK